MLTMLTMDSPLGALRLIAADDALVGLYLPAQDDQVAALAIARDRRPSPVLARAAAQLGEYFAGERRAFDLPLEPRGTGFQERVWRALARIPFGEARRYGDIAAAIGRPAASRAVGTANGRNPISIIVPCHRVIASTGALTGYAGGLAAKRWLLDHERRVTCPVAASTVNARSS